MSVRPYRPRFSQKESDMQCAALSYSCTKEAKWKVPLFGETAPHCLCDDHVKDWRKHQPENVKAIDDDSPWVNPETGYKRESRVLCR